MAFFENAEEQQNYLTSFELAAILEKCFSLLSLNGEPPIEMTHAYVNCYLQTLESGYAFRKITKYIAATQKEQYRHLVSIMKTYSYNYVMILINSVTIMKKAIVTLFGEKAILNNRL